MSLHPTYLSPLHASGIPASFLLHLCEEPGCHGLELWNTSLREVSAWGWEQED